MAIDYIALGQRISDFRNKHNFSQEELALHISFAICSLSIFLLIEIFLSSVFLQQKTPDNQGHPTHLFMLAVSLDTLPSITSRRKFKSPTRTHHISQVWARCPAEHHNVPVINLPSRSTAFMCRHTETFLAHLYYT